MRDGLFELQDKGTNQCPICGCEKIGWLALNGDNWNPLHDYPHIAFPCGGLYRVIEGVWVGRCGNRSLLKQKMLNLVEE